MLYRVPMKVNIESGTGILGGKTLLAIPCYYLSIRALAKVRNRSSESKLRCIASLKVNPHS